MIKKYKIALSSLNLCRPMTGVGRYILDLSKIKSNYFVFNAYTPNAELKLVNEFKNIFSSNYNTKLGKLIWTIIPHNKGNESIIHYPQPLMSPFDFRKKIIVTIHDLLFLELCEHYSFRERLLLKISTWIVVKKAHTIICVSNYTKNELIKKYNPKCNIEVVYNPISNRIQELLNTKKIIEDKYLLCVSNRSPRKNLQKSIDGFLKSKYADNGYKLVLCGTNDSSNKIDLPQNVIDMGYVDDSKLELLYKNANALIFFSLGEGFGYPILEAAKNKTLVFAADNSSISELFNFQSELLCQDYKSVSGISSFLNKTYESEDLKNNISRVLEETLKKCSFNRFERKMNDIYNKI